MKKIEITEEIAKQMYESGVESLKQLAELNFPETFKKKVSKWEDLVEISGFYINQQSLIKDVDTPAISENRNVYPTQWEAEAHGIIYPMLAQVRDRMNGMPLIDVSKLKKCHAVSFFGAKVSVFLYQPSDEGAIGILYPFIFKTEELANQFLESKRELLNKYYNINN